MAFSELETNVQRHVNGQVDQCTLAPACIKQIKDWAKNILPDKNKMTVQVFANKEWTGSNSGSRLLVTGSGGYT